MGAEPEQTTVQQYGPQIHIEPPRFQRANGVGIAPTSERATQISSQQSEFGKRAIGPACLLYQPSGLGIVVN